MAQKRSKTGIAAVDKVIDELWSAIPALKRAQLYLFGAVDTDTTASDRYLYPGYQSSTATTSDRWQVALHDGFLTNLAVNVRDGGDTSGTVTVIVRIASKDTALSVAFEQKATGVFRSRPELSVPVKAGDRVSVVVRKTVAPVTAQTVITANFELVY